MRSPILCVLHLHGHYGPGHGAVLLLIIIHCRLQVNRQRRVQRVRQQGELELNLNKKVTPRAFERGFRDAPSFSVPRKSRSLPSGRSRCPTGRRAKKWTGGASTCAKQPPLARSRVETNCTLRQTEDSLQKPLRSIFKPEWCSMLNVIKKIGKKHRNRGLFRRYYNSSVCGSTRLIRSSFFHVNKYSRFHYLFSY